MAFGGLMLENRNGSVNMYIPSVVRVGSYSFYGDIFPHMVISFSINYWQLLPPIPIMVVCVCYWRGKLIMEIWRVIRELPISLCFKCQKKGKPQKTAHEVLRSRSSNLSHDLGQVKKHPHLIFNTSTWTGS